MNIPPFLKKGDNIGIVATARKITLAECTHAVNILKKWGLKPIFGKTISQFPFSGPGSLSSNPAESRQFAGTDDFRAADFQQMLDNSEIKAVLCGRGGYGTVRIVDKIDFSRFQQQPKWVIGYSDITVLHCHIVENFGVPTIHATMPVDFEKNTSDALESLRKALFGERTDYQFRSTPLNRKGMAKGILVGGNLSVLYSLLGSVSDVDTAGKIVFLEDLDEYLYHIDRMMMAWKRAGKLEKPAGLLIGGMNEMNDNATPFGKTAYQIISEHLAECDYPVAFGFSAGHIANNRALVMGKEMVLNVGYRRVKLMWDF